MSTTLVPQLQGGLLQSDLTDFISRMPDDVLVMKLGLLPIKEAVVTSSLSKRWRFLWCDVTRLHFVGPKTFYRYQSINEVNAIIKSYHPPIVQDFRIGFCLRYSPVTVIHEWLQFAVNKKVEFLELDLMNIYNIQYEGDSQYDFPSRIFETKFRSRSSNAMFVEILSLKKLVLKKVNVTESILKELLTNCPNLETIAIHFSKGLNSICIGGRALKLKHFEIFGRSISSIYLSDFDLESFAYKGLSIDLRLTNLPKLKKVDLYNPISWRPSWLPGSHCNVFDQIASCALSLQALSLDLMFYPPLDSLPELTNLKKLSLAIGGSKCNFLLDLASILNACPNLETLTLQPFWTSPITNKRKARDVTIPYPCLKVVEIMGYCGRNCDFELVEYIIHSSVALKKIVIDTSSRRYGNDPKYAFFKPLKNKEDARSSANRQLTSINQERKIPKRNHLKDNLTLNFFLYWQKARKETPSSSST